MEFSSSKESILRMKQMFDSQTLCNILCLPINKGCKTKCKPFELPPQLDQTCQFPMMSFSSHNKAGENTTNWGSKKRFCTSQTVCNISFRVSGYMSKESKNSHTLLRNLSTTSTTISLRKNKCFVTTLHDSRSLSLCNKRRIHALSSVTHVILWKVNPRGRDSIFNRQPSQWSLKIMQNQRENGKRRKAWQNKHYEKNKIKISQLYVERASLNRSCHSKAATATTKTSSTERVGQLHQKKAAEKGRRKRGRRTMKTA